MNNEKSKPFAHQHSMRIADALESMYIFDLNGDLFTQWDQLVTTDNTQPNLGFFWSVEHQALYAAPINTVDPTLVWVPVDCFVSEGVRDMARHLKTRMLQISILVRRAEIELLIRGLLRAEHAMNLRRSQTCGDAT